MCRKNNLKPGGNFFYAVKQIDKDANMEVEFFYPAENAGSMLRNGLIPGRTTVILHIENAKMKLALMNNTAGSDIKGQKENVEKFCQLVKNL